VLIASFLIFNLFIGIVINSMNEARSIELHREEKALLENGGQADDERVHAMVVNERLRHLKSAVEELERELKARPPATGPPTAERDSTGPKAAAGV
jgi:voltage-gated sodium channel